LPNAAQSDNKLLISHHYPRQAAISFITSHRQIIMIPRLKSKLCAAGALVAIAASSHAAVRDGLVNYWNFDNNLIDVAHGVLGTASSVADNGTFAGTAGTAGITFGAGLFVGAIDLDGAAGVKQNNGFVNVLRSRDTLFGANATNPGSPNTVTTSMWVTVAGHDQSWQTLLSHGEGSQYRMATRDTSTNASYAGGVGDIPTANGIGPDLAGGAWHHVLAISEGGVSTRLWVDGGLVDTGGVPVIDDARGGGLLNLAIGANPDTGAQNREWWGKIDEVAQWNRALSDAEIGQIWGGGSATARSIGAQIIPEPASVFLGLLGFIGGAVILRRRR